MKRKIAPLGVFCLFLLATAVHAAPKFGNALSSDKPTATGRDAAIRIDQGHDFTIEFWLAVTQVDADVPLLADGFPDITLHPAPKVKKNDPPAA